uniref:Uncharacterized protein n=1 Tax=Solanum tuberosum TaxID=4113 RepID=M1CFB8_SOLTU
MKKTSHLLFVSPCKGVHYKIDYPEPDDAHHHVDILSNHENQLQYTQQVAASQS